MKLYLSSYRTGCAKETLLSLIGGNKTAVIIENAVDYLPADEREIYRIRFFDQKKEFESLGISSERLDLRDFFDHREKLYDILKAFGLIWCTGGNAFLLRRAMRQSGFDTCIKRLLDIDGVIYGGYSAGAVVASPSLHGIELMDDPNIIADKYNIDILWEGLGLVDFSIVPHFQSDHPETLSASNTVKHLTTIHYPYKAMQDGDVYIQDGGKNSYHSLSI